MKIPRNSFYFNPTGPLAVSVGPALDCVTGYSPAVVIPFPDEPRGRYRVMIRNGSNCHEATDAIAAFMGRSLGRSFRDCLWDPIPWGEHVEGGSCDATRTDPSYASLRRALDAAYDQSAEGKGKARHGNGLDFDQQPIMKIGRMVGAGYPVGQAMKKGQEAIGMARRGEHDAAKAELLGVIVYAAAAYLLLEEAN